MSRGLHMPSGGMRRPGPSSVDTDGVLRVVVSARGAPAAAALVGAGAQDFVFGNSRGVTSGRLGV